MVSVQVTHSYPLLGFAHLQRGHKLTWTQCLSLCYDRAFFFELSVLDQPLITVITGGDACPLPTEPRFMEDQAKATSRLAVHQLPAGSPVSCLSAPGVGHFGRLAQVAWIMDQLLDAFKIPSIDLRLPRLERLDATLQEFLGTLLQAAGTSTTDFYLCEAIALTFKSVSPAQPP